MATKFLNKDFKCNTPTKVEIRATHFQGSNKLVSYIHTVNNENNFNPKMRNYYELCAHSKQLQGFIRWFFCIGQKRCSIGQQNISLIVLGMTQLILLFGFRFILTKIMYFYLKWLHTELNNNYNLRRTYNKKIHLFKANT